MCHVHTKMKEQLLLLVLFNFPFPCIFNVQGCFLNLSISDTAFCIIDPSVLMAAYNIMKDERTESLSFSVIPDAYHCIPCALFVKE